MKARELVGYLRGVRQVGIGRAYKVVELQKSTYHYKSRRPLRAALKKRICGIAETRVRYEYRRIHVLLKREG